jgi:hypothetical protein
MQMQVLYYLPTLNPGINYHTIAPCSDPLLAGYLAGSQQNMARQLFVCFSQVIK